MRTLTRRIVTEPSAPFPSPLPAPIRPRLLRAALPALAFLVLGVLVFLLVAQRELARQSQTLLDEADALFDRVAAELIRAADSPSVSCDWLRSGTPLPADFELLREPVATPPAKGGWCNAVPPDAATAGAGRSARLSLGNWPGDPSRLLAEIVFPDGRVLGARIDTGALARLVHPAGMTAARWLQWRDAGRWQPLERIDPKDQAGRLGPSAPPARALVLMSAAQVSQRHPYSVGASLDAAALWQKASEWLVLIAAGALITALATWVAWQRRQAHRNTPGEQLRHALARGEFEGHLQPILDLGSGRCVGAELLLHWRHPREGLLTAAHFIEEARREGLSWSMTENCFIEVAARLDQCGRVPDGFMLCVNLGSAELVRDRDSERFVTLARPGGRRWYTVIELPEGQARERAMPGRLATLQDAGFLIALDCFGTAHSGTRWLDRMSVDLVKIDPAIVATIGTDSVTRPVLDAIIELARQTGVRLIAEGVINTQQAAHLRREGVGYGQGSAFSGPLPAAQFIASWLGAPSSPADDDLAGTDDDDDDPTERRRPPASKAPLPSPVGPLSPAN